MSYSHTLPGQDRTESIARFFLDKQQNNFKSQREGHAVYDDVEMVEIIIPGDNKTQVTSMVRQEHKDRWPRQYEAFKKGLEPAVDGYPIEHWAPVTAAQAANFKAVNVPTVEALAAVSDANLHALGIGARQLRDRAKAWLEQARDGEPLAKALAELENERAEKLALQTQVADLAAAVRRLEDKLNAE